MVNGVFHAHMRGIGMDAHVLQAVCVRDPPAVIALGLAVCDQGFHPVCAERLLRAYARACQYKQNSEKAPEFWSRNEMVSDIFHGFVRLICV